MPSTYTTSGIELIGDGEQSGTWGGTTNENLQILDRMVSQAGIISLSGTSHTLAVTDGGLSEGQYAVLVFGGSPSGTNTVTITPNDAQRTYFVKNDSGQSVVLTQGTGGDVTVADGDVAIVYCDGAGTGAEVVDISGLTSNDIGVTVQAYSSVLQNTTASFTTADETKLDGIEAGADVTDTANVTAAGALMDSELTSIASVKALDQGVATTDSPSFAGLAVDTNVLYVDSANNRVGIGTSSPRAILDVFSNGNNIVAGDGTVDLEMFAGASLGRAIIGTDTNHPLVFRTNNSEHVRIDTSGNVGIGTSSPSEKLSVSGNISVTGTVDGRDIAADGARLDLEPITPQDYGAVGDGTTDDTTAMQSWVTELRTNGGYGYLPAGTYKVSTLHMHPEESFRIVGAGKDTSTILIDNSDRTAVGLKFTHTDGTTRNAGEYELEAFSVESAAGNKACLIEHINSSAPRLCDIKLVAYTGTSALRYAQVYNGDFLDVDVWGAGHNVPFKDVGSATFSITSGTTTLTASASVFAAGDVGRKITLVNGGTNETFTIASYTSGTEVEVNTATVTASAVPGSFGGVRGSMTAASATLTLEANRLTSDDVGRVVYVLGAGPSVTGSSIPLRSTITAVSGTSITLADAATASVTNAELIFDPAVDFGNTLNSYSDYTNDFHLDGLMVPQYRGTGLVASGAGFMFNALKLHGVNDGQNELATNIQALFSYFQGYVDGRLEQSVCGNVARIIIAGGRRGWTPTFGQLELGSQYGLPMFYGQDCNAGVVGIGDVKVIGDTALDLVSDIHSDDGSVTFTRNGTIALYGSDDYDSPTDNDTFYVDRVNARLGVNTKFPSSELDVRSSGQTNAQLTSTSNNANFLIQAADGYVSRLWLGDNTDYDVGSIQYLHFPNAMTFTVNASERLRIDSSGNLLIGTSTTGASKLRIVGLPTSSTGLSSGDVWNDGGTLKIV